MERVKLSVHRVVDWVLRCGDIDSRYVDASTMQQGAAAHRKIQKAMTGDYRKEVSLSLETEAGGFPLLLQGRADGVFTAEDGLLTIDEIKSTTLPLEKLAVQQAQHLGQAQCYAYMLLQTLDAPPETVGVQLTYYQLETEELQRRRFVFSREEIAAFFADLLLRYGDWLRFEHEWKVLRDASIAAAAFPFPAYRRGQRDLAAAAYRTIVNRKKLYVQAPTGIGKTLSTLFPAVKAVEEGRLEKLFYLTAKTVTRTVAEEAVTLMESQGLRFKSVTLRAKDKICFCEETICNPDSCPYAKGHYDRVNDALMDMLTHHDRITPAVVEAYCRQYRLCPHETALDAALWADLVIWDYNHVFDPAAYLRRFFDGDEEHNYGFLIDEAHNLADRVRDMYSAVLRRSAFSRLARQLPDKTKTAAALRKSLRAVAKYLADAGKALGDADEAANPEKDAAIGALVTLFCSAAEDWLAEEQNNSHERLRDVLELYFEATAFQGIAELYDEHFTTLTETREGDVIRTLFCLDPSAIIAERLKLAKASVLLSATLTPLPYYRELLGGDETDPLLSLPSPFEEERLLLVAHGGISTKYKDRAASYAPIAEAIAAVIARKTGNYLIFFPSYDYMRQVHERFTALCPGVAAPMQDSHMEEEERAAFLARFDAENADTLAGFCVLGGLFSEGIDLKGDRLIGTVIVGVGLPGLSLRQNEIREYFNRKNGRGYDYAYVYPGMNKVLQAAGRVIRSADDAGVAVLIDSRFHTAAYRALFPPHWSQMRRVRDTASLRRLLAAFPYFSAEPEQPPSGE